MLIRERCAITAYLRGIVFDQHLAEDLYQNTVVIALKKKDQLRNTEGVMPWLMAIARREALAGLRKRSAAPKCFDDELLDLLDQSWTQALERQAASDRASALEHCVQRLTSRSRELLRRRYVDGLTGAELAERVGAKVDSCYVALSRIHKKLRECVRVYQTKNA